MPSAAERMPFWAVVAVVVVLDRITKIIAESALAAGRVISVVGDVVQFRLVYNRGAAFGIHIGEYSRWFFLVVAIGAVWILHRMWRDAAVGDRLRLWSVSVVAGGAAGNAIDRIISQPGVVDFIDVGLSAGGWRWPTFNIADIAVSCGAVALALSLWREDAQRARASTT